MIKIFLILFCGFVYAQDSTLLKLKDVVASIDTSINRLEKKVKWDYDNVLWYNVYYVAGDDSSKFPLDNGLEHSSFNKGFYIWEWQTGSTLYNFFYVKKTDKKFYRVGIIGVTKDGLMGRMICRTYDN